MKTLKTIFVGILGAWMCMGGHAADNGCSKDSNDRISPAIALCSTHVYNIGATENQSDSAAKQYMNDVVALKTTLITQQMYKQYEYLDATIRRLKTQLEKAVLTASLEASGAATSSSSGTSGSASRDSNVILAGAENCVMKSTPDNQLECLQNNIRIVLNAVSANNIGNAKRQLEKDLSFAVQFGVIKKTENKYLYNNGSDISDCNNVLAPGGINRDNVNNCAYSLNVQVGNKIDERSRQSSSYMQKRD